MCKKIIQHLVTVVASMILSEGVSECVQMYIPKFKKVGDLPFSEQDLTLW